MTQKTITLSISKNVKTAGGFQVLQVGIPLQEAQLELSLHVLNVINSKKLFLIANKEVRSCLYAIVY